MGTSTNSIKSEGFIIEIVLPALTCSAKLKKKILKSLPAGSTIDITLTDKSLNGQGSNNDK